MSGFVQSGRFGFNPLQLSPTVWLDASDSATITASGGAVSSWADKSGNGWNVAQTVAGSKPTTGSTTQNGLNTLSFDGGDGLVTASNFSITGATARTVIAVVKTTSSTGFSWWGGWGTGATRTGFILGRNINTSNLRLAVFGEDYITTTSFGTSAYGLASVTYDGNVTAKAWKNAAACSPSSATFTTALNTGASKLAIGYSIVYNENWTGQVAEVLIFASELSTADRQSVETYLNAKWAIY